MRTPPFTSTISQISIKIKKPLYDAILLVLSLKDLSNKYEVKYTNFSHNVGFGGMVQRILSVLSSNNSDIEHYMGVSGLGPIYKSKSFNSVRNDVPSWVPETTILKIFNNENLRAKYIGLAEQKLADTISGKSKNTDAKIAFSAEKELYTSPSKFCNDYHLDPTKKCVFIMLHAFNDFPNHFKAIHFDYKYWIDDTIDQITNLPPEVNWIIKDHPSSRSYKSSDLDSVKEYVENKISQNDNIIFISDENDFTTGSLKDIAHAIVTAAGTAASEFACYGIPSIHCSYTYYSYFKFSTLATNKAHYYELLAGINNLKKIQGEKVQLAKIFYYITHHIVYAATFNRKGPLPVVSHANRLENNSDLILSFYSNFILSKDCSPYIAKMEAFIKSDCNMYFDEDELFDIENSTSGKGISESELVSFAKGIDDEELL